MIKLFAGVVLGATFCQIKTGKMGRKLKVAVRVAALLLAALGATWVFFFFTDSPLPPGAVADRLVLEKGHGRLTLFQNDIPLKSYAVACGRAPGKKERQGDHRTPEGRFTIDARNKTSRYYLALHISYPRYADGSRAGRPGVNPGGDIVLHGLPPDLAWVGRGHSLINWTQGCIAVTNREMDELWRAVPLGTVIDIKP